jgi:hypothetical protein
LRGVRNQSPSLARFLWKKQEKCTKVSGLCRTRGELIAKIYLRATADSMEVVRRALVVEVNCGWLRSGQRNSILKIEHFPRFAWPRCHAAALPGMAAGKPFT